MINVKDLSVCMGEHILVDQVSFTAQVGEVTGLIGPNGAGKSTVLAAVAGDIDYSGEITVGGLSPKAPARELARTRAVMLQDVSVSFEFLVRDVVAMGRRPWEGTAYADLDDDFIDAALDTAGVAHLAGRDISTLSGGERARAAFARVLAQNTPVILLDEPTAALDIRHQEQLLGSVKALAREAGVAVLVVLHDLNLAARYSDSLFVMRNGAIVTTGSPTEVIDAETLDAAFGLRAHVMTDPITGGPLIVPLDSRTRATPTAP